MTRIRNLSGQYLWETMLPLLAWLNSISKSLITVAYGVTGNSQMPWTWCRTPLSRHGATWRAGAARGPFSAWLCRIATNLALDHLRKRKRLVPAEQLSGTGQGLMWKRRSLKPKRPAELNRAVDALPEAYRLLIVLRHTGNFFLPGNGRYVGHYFEPGEKQVT